MSFTFEQVKEHRVFTNTFLRRVIVYASFDKKGVDFFNENFNLSLKKYLLSMYNVEDIGEFPHKAIKLKNDEDNLEVMLSNGAFLLAFEQKGYKSFIDSVVPHLIRLKLFAEQLMGAGSYDELRIRKVNIWRFGYKEKADISYDMAAKAVFSKELLQADNIAPLTDDERTLPIHSKLVWTEDSQTLKLLTGFAKLSDNAYNLVLDTEVIQSAKVKNGELTDTLLKMNGTMFDAYQWSINDKIRSLMDDK